LHSIKPAKNPKSLPRNTSDMPDPQRRAPRPSLQQLLWHCLMGVALGVLCAGLLLQVPSSAGDSLIAGPETSYKTLRFLLSFAFLFGLGATLTGAMFLSHDKS
jgi:hypothetical protein